MPKEPRFDRVQKSYATVGELHNSSSNLVNSSIYLNLLTMKVKIKGNLYEIELFPAQVRASSVEDEINF